MDSYRVGDVVNGHVWTGTAWEVAPPPPAPARTAAKFKPPEPGDDVKAWGTICVIGAFVSAALAVMWFASEQLKDYSDSVTYLQKPSEPEKYIANLALAGSRMGDLSALGVGFVIAIAVAFVVGAAYFYRRAAQMRRAGHPRATSDEK